MSWTSRTFIRIMLSTFSQNFNNWMPLNSHILQLHWNVVLITKFSRVTLWMYMFNDGCHWWQIGINFIERLDQKILLIHRCQILRLLNKTPSPLRHWVRACYWFMWCILIRTVDWMHNVCFALQHAGHLDIWTD